MISKLSLTRIFGDPPCIPICVGAFILLMATYFLLDQKRKRQLARYRLYTTPDILLQIFPLLPRADLANCCLVNRLFFDMACTELYGSRDGILVGIRRYYGWGGDHPSHHLITSSKRTLLAGADRPIETDTTNPEIMEIVDELYICATPPYRLWRQFKPSPTKLRLLRHVRHIIYATDRKREYDTLNSAGWFPVLETLSIRIIGPRHAKPVWSEPFLSNLRPRHIRITCVRTLGSEYGAALPFYLSSLLGSRVERVTIHFIDCNVYPQVDHTKTKVIDVKWPPSVKHIDLVFLAPTSDSRDGTFWSVPLHDFTYTRPALIPAGKFDHVIRTIVALLTSVSKLDVTVRIIGMGTCDAADVGHAYSWSVAGTEQWGEAEAEKFGKTLTTVYLTGLKGGGMAEALAVERVGELEFVSMKDYKQEVAYAPFA